MIPILADMFRISNEFIPFDILINVFLDRLQLISFLVAHCYTRVGIPEGLNILDFIPEIPLFN